MVITKIERQQRHPHRVNVYVDGEFAFGIHEEVLIKLGLRKGDGLQPQAIKEIESAEEFNLAKEKALRLVSYRLRSEKELRSRLEEKEFHPTIIDRTIEHLRTIGILDDNKFAFAFVNNLLMRKPAGKTLLQRELRSRGIPSETIQHVLQEKLGDQEEQDLALEAVRKLLKRYQSSSGQTDEKKQRQRIANFLARRGFGWSTINFVLKTLVQHQVTTSDEE